ncbi:MAG TPA: nodulation protein NfeD [Candidatus Polarisedimenticolia bacterium]|nr:nodulation protein NfeD [Candidatus Polarisedimenticolia bacterium]
MRHARGRALRLLLLLAIAAGGAVPSRADPPAPAPDGVVDTVVLDSVIHPIAARLVREAIKAANDRGARLIIIKIDTPGGLVTSMEEIVKAITSSRVPVVVFVNGSKAASAGFFITIAADVAVMAPGTRFGAAHPVLAVGELPKDSPMMAKIENDLAAYARSLANNRGRNEKVAEDAVRKSSAFTEKEALKLRLIDYICRDENEILSVLDGKTIRRFDGTSTTLHLRGARIEPLDISLRDRLLSYLADPTIALILLLAGVVGLYIEFTHPGMIAPGVIGAISLLLFALVSQILPVNWGGVALVVTGLVMFLLELKVPSYGTLTIGGMICLVLGALMLFKSEPGMPSLGAARWMIVSIAGSAALIMATLTTLVVRSLRHKPTTGDVGLQGERGTALSDVDPEGRVFVHGEYWNARAARTIKKGAKIRVIRVNDLMLEVEEVP